MKSDENPILNNPYEEPQSHYATNSAGELDYSRPVKGRRIFTPEIQSIPVRQGAQGELMELNETAAAEHGSHIVNLLRREVTAWRQAKYPQTTRITRELLHFWFLNPERDATQCLFFAQREAIETAIWLNEVAEKSNVGQHILRQLEEAQKVSASPENNLPRIAFKMATGSGKTVVMGALIAYHYFNRAEYRNDVRFADNFLIVAPGITIRDRLGVLRVDTRLGVDAEDYYHVRYLVPPLWRKEMPELNNHLVITNYHSFEPKALQGNKRSPFDGKIQPDGTKQESTEDHSQVISRLLGNFRPGSRLLIINDEAHHCYLPRESDEKAEGENAEEENRRAAVWFSGLVRIVQRFKVRHIYDLSATPYYLTGSGYDPYSLFQWVVSDFGLIEAVESGLVKIPFLPTRDDTQEIGLPVLRNLYDHIRDRLPKAGRKTAKARAKAEGKKLTEEPPQLPETLKIALKQFYEHYEEEYKNRRHSAAATGTNQLSFEDSPPVFIVVCNNTSVSKEVYKYLAGYEISSEAEAKPSQIVSGAYDLFSNYDSTTNQSRNKPPTLLIDSDALENSEQIDDEFKRVFAPEIKRFKEEYARVHGQGSAENIEDSVILREVVNTVGKRNALGAHIRCVVSVSMLTEGWDANTVTHICGIRKFGSQLLCEQVAGRALRRQSYYLQGYDKDNQPTTDKRRIVIQKFPPEYAHIIGVPFKLFKGGKTVPPPPRPTTRIYAMAERIKKYEITFPNVDGYRLEYAEGPLVADFYGVENYEMDGSRLPTKTVMGTAISKEEVKLTVDDVLAMREQQIIYRIAKDLLRDHFSNDNGSLQFYRFHELSAIVTKWYHTKVRVLGKGEEWKKLLYFYDPKALVAHVARAIKTGKPGEEAIRPILNYYNPTGSSRFVHGQTSRETYPTQHSQVNAVVIDSGWEGRAAKVLDDLYNEGHVTSWVKNAFLDFHIPYTDIHGEQRDYFPDFIVRCRNGEPLNLILEISGMRKDKALKKWTVINRWLPAVNRIREQHDWDKWDFLEIANEVELADMRNILVKFLENPSATKVSSLIWAKRADYIAMWTDTMGTAERDKSYVVQTVQKVILRCILMTTDPGDLVLDPTCGSGTTAYVAEQWARRWITCDTSRIAVNVAKTRLMTATFPYYQLYDQQNCDLRQGFIYKKVPHIMLGSIANNEPAAEETLYDQPQEDKKRLRVAGPFTVETLQSYEPISPDELTRQRTEDKELGNFEELIFTHLKSAGVKTGIKEENAVFVRIDRLADSNLHAEGWYPTAAGEKKAYLHIGPKFGTVSKQAVTEAIKACRDKRDGDWLLIMGFAFESGITELSRSFGNFHVSIVRMHDDLLQLGLLKKDKKAASFVTIGEPDIKLHVSGPLTPTLSPKGGRGSEKVGARCHFPLPHRGRGPG